MQEAQRPGCSGRCQRWPPHLPWSPNRVLQDGVDGQDEVTQCSTTPVDRGLNRQQTSTSLSCHSQKKAALHHRQWGLNQPLLPKPWKIQKPWSRCTSHLCLCLQFQLAQSPVSASVRDCSLFWCFFVYVHCLHIYVAFCVFFFFLRREEVGRSWAATFSLPHCCLISCGMK